MASLLPSSWVGRAMIGVAIWYLAVLGLWAVRPMTDHVPVVPAEALPEGVAEPAATSEPVDCHAPISRDGGVRGDAPLPSSYETEAGDFPRVYERRPCAGIVTRSAWRLLMVDTVVAAGVIGALGYVVQRRRRHAGSPVPSP